MTTDELFQATSQAMLSGLGRDAASGSGAIVYTLSPGSLKVTTLQTRTD